MEAPRVGSNMPEPGTFDPWEIPNVIGGEVAAVVAAVLEVLQQVGARRSISPSELNLVLRAMHRIKQIAVHSQQVSRLATGRLRQSHERVSLTEVLQRVLADNERRYLEAGVDLELHLQEIEVVLDPTLLCSLCEVVLDCAARLGGRLQVWLTMMNWPEHALLTIRARPHVQEGTPSALAGDSLDWVLLTCLADAAGVTLTREELGGFTELKLEFARTVKQVQGLTAIEVDAPSSNDSRPFAGHRVLLVTSDEGMAWEVKAICQQMRLVLDTVPDVRAAARFCELDVPQLIVLDAVLLSPEFEDLRQDLLRQNMNLPIIEIVREDNAVELGGWGHMAARLSRSELRHQLQSMLTMELARVF